MFSHPMLTSLLDKIDRVHHQHGDFHYAMLITGESGVGKTFLAQSYIQGFPVQESKTKAIIPVVYCKLTQTKTANDLLNQLTYALGASSEKNITKSYIIEKRLQHLIKEHHVELIIVDEVQECLPDIEGITAQRMAKQFAALIDNTQIPFILLGTPVAARLLKLNYGSKACKLAKEEQLARRFIAEQILLPIPARCQAWLDCVNYFCNKYIFKTFSIQDKILLNRLYVATQGKPGLLNKLFSFLPTQHTDISVEDLFQSFELSISIQANNPFDCHLFTDEDIDNILNTWNLRG